MGGPPDCASVIRRCRLASIFNQGIAAPRLDGERVNDGEKTNTAPLSSCAYDRIILNPTINLVYLDHGTRTNRSVQGISVSPIRSGFIARC